LSVIHDARFCAASKNTDEKQTGARGARSIDSGSRVKLP
jgi:hypothetical protein